MTPDTKIKRRVVVVKIEFEIDEENANEGLETPLTDGELIEYAKGSFIDDILTLSHNYPELYNAIQASIEERE